MTLTRYDHQKGCFVLAGPTHKFKCKCPPDSPFHWTQDKRLSVFAKDINFRASGSGKTHSQISTEHVEQARAEGTMAGFLRGISRNREEEILRIRTFQTFSVAIHDAKRKVTSSEVPTVRGVDKRTGVKDT